MLSSIRYATRKIPMTRLRSGTGRRIRIGQRQQLHQPRNEAELQQLLRDSHGKVRVLGNRLSPGRMLCVQPQDVLLDLSAARHPRSG